MGQDVCSLIRLGFVIFTEIGLQGRQSGGGSTAGTSTDWLWNLFHDGLNVTAMVSVGTCSLQDGHLPYPHLCLWMAWRPWHNIWQSGQRLWVLHTDAWGTGATRPALVRVWWFRRQSALKKKRLQSRHRTAAGPAAVEKSRQWAWWQLEHFRPGQR